MSTDINPKNRPKFPWSAALYLIVVWLAFIFLLSLVIGPLAWHGLWIIPVIVVGLAVLAMSQID